ncbi:titin-like protein, partial [Dinothrombium tinctorium]
MCLTSILCFLLLLCTSINSSSPPKLIPMPTLQPFKEGSAFRLLCSVQYGAMPLKFNWFFNSKLITYQLHDINIETREDESTLKIKNVKSENSGNYTCVVSNEFGKDSQSVMLVVKSPLKWLVEPKDLHLIHGEAGKIECKATGFPLPTVTWYKNSEIVSKNEEINIERASKNDKGVYECVADNEINESLRKMVKVGVKFGFSNAIVSKMISIITSCALFYSIPFVLSAAESPKIQPFSSLHYVNEGMKFGALCIISQGTEPLRFQWFKSGFPISNHISNAKIETSSIVSNLIFEKVTRADSANYTCVVSNSFGEDSKSFTLSVKVSLKWIEEPQDSTVIERRDFIINCKAEGIPPPQIKWKKGQIEVQRNKETLELKSMTLGDSGEYECIAENGVDDPLRKKFKISVIEPPKIQPIPPFPPFSEGFRVTALCSVLQGTGPLEFNWYKHDTPINKHLSNIKIETNSGVSTLIFEKVSRNDSGNYTCVVSNAYGEDKTSFVLTIKVAMKWIEEPKDMTIVGGNGIIINCIAEGFPRPQISWWKNKNVILSHSERFEIKIADYKDKGEYECKADNGVDQELSKKFKIIVVDSPIIQSMLPTQTLSEGVTFNALCSVLKGSKPLHFSWLKDGLTLQKDGKDIKIETSSVASTLFFEKVTRTDSGNYTCVVTNSLGEDRKSFLLTVKVSLHWIEAPEDVTFLEGRDVYINCNAEGFPKPQIKWKKNAREVLTNKERMEIRNIKIEDAGNYECIAENGVDEVLSKKFRIIVAASDCSVAPKVVPFPLFSPFNENRPFAVLCTVQDGSFPLKFQWFKDNKPIDKQRENIEIETTESNSNLRIRQLKQNHSGNYTCSVRNAYGTDSQTVSLLVKAPLMWSKEPKDIGVRVNSDVDVECFATGIPFPKISWKRNGNQSNVKKHLIVIIEAGTYECVADNGIASPLVKSIKISVYGKRMKTTAFRIIATQEAPKILPSLPLLSLSAGSRFVTMCTISQGTSPIYFKWNKNGKQVDLKKINIKTEEITSTLTIDKVTREDSGNYSCTAENAFGKDTRIIQLMVKIPLVWKIEPQNMIIVESKSLELVCDADGIPAPKISWFKKETNTFVSERSKLRIEKVTKSSEGDYECIADNGVDAPLKKRVKVMVVDSPKLLPLSNLPPLNEGSIFMSLCAIQQGSVPLKFKWLKDGKPLITDANVNIESNDLSSTLRIHSVKLTNAGNYTCIVKNSLGEDRQTTSLIVKASVRWIKEPRDLRLNLDENGFLECKAFGIPSPRITWMYNDKVLESNIERLSIKGISKSSGKYECIADNGVDPPLRKSVHVLITAKSGACVYTIYSISIQSDNSVNMSKILLYVTVFVAIKFTFASKAPKLLPIPALTPINEGSSFRLFCVVSEGSSPLIFNWKKNGFNLINENEIETTDRDSTLKIKEMKPLLNGNYTCEVTNNFGKDSQTTTVIVKAPLKWVKEPKDLNLILKEDGLIECE